jgi:tetratricopeptide (TPR) repeat protein
MKTLLIRIGILSALCIFAISEILFAQDFKTPRPSPNATVSQTIGITDVTIHYSRPGVKNRIIWGQLVPYNKVWRTGANEVTSITFTEPVKINGNPLPAGTYGIHTIPTENEWIFLFSGNTEVGASSEFKENDVVLKIKVKPETASFTERMIFTFTDVTDTSSNVNLIWDKLKVSFEIMTETQKLVLAKAEKAIDWSTPMQAAFYCLQNNLDLDKAMNWINASTEINENYWNLRIKARLLEKQGNKKEAIILMEKAINYGNEMRNKPPDFDQMQKLLKEWKG